jgi:DNA modification methylase
MAITSEVQARVRYECERCGAATDGFGGTERELARVCRECFGKAEDRRPRELNDLTGKEWAQLSRSVQEFPDTRSEKQKAHGAAFPQSLARQQISIYTKPGQTVLDPFLGVGTTLDACAEIGRKGIGFEISPEYHAMAAADLSGLPDQRAILGDARNLGEHVAPASVDMVFTSPPYGNLLRNVKGSFAYKWREHSTIAPVSNPGAYSDNPDDIGNLAYDDYLAAITHVMGQTFDALKPGGYAVWVVKDFRAMKEKIPFVPLHMDVSNCAVKAGFTMWDIQIYDQTRFRPLVCLGYPSSNYYLNIGHSYNLVFRKWT